MPRLYDPYITTKPSGLGMGLMISRTIVESHGGSLRYVSQRGAGATFRFTLPTWREQ
jgi:two-component system, LuxR family, sensor kinase FixL